MKQYLAMGLATVLAMGTTGCMVKKSEYLAAVSEAETAKTELEKTRSHKSALEHQVKSLKDLNGKLANEAELAGAELQRIKDSRDKERGNVEGRVKELEVRLKETTSQQRNLRQEYEELKQRNESLKTTVTRYQKELKERQRSISVPSLPTLPRASATPPSMPTPPSFPAAVGSAPSAEKSSPDKADTGMAKTAKAPAGLSPININTASASDMVLFLGLTKDTAEQVITNRPYRVKGELVAKSVVPKNTFDLIKDRITVAAQ